MSADFVRTPNGLRASNLTTDDATFNFSGEEPTSVLELVHAIRKLMGREDVEPDVRNTATGEIKDQYLSAAKARERLDWTPSYSLDQGLIETIAWYRAYLGA